MAREKFDEGSELRNIFEILAYVRQNRETVDAISVDEGIIRHHLFGYPRRGWYRYEDALTYRKYVKRHELIDAFRDTLFIVYTEEE